MRVEERLSSINAETNLYLVLGNPVRHSLSPVIHNAGFEALKVNSLYLASEVSEEQIAEAIEGLKVLGIAGANITSPFKEAVIPYLDSITDVAEMLRSVNTIVNSNGRLVGYSTDGAGFISALEHLAPDYDFNSPATIVGAGGAARAVAYALAEKGVEEFNLINRSRARADLLHKLLIDNFSLECSVHSLESPGLDSLINKSSLIVYTLPTDSLEFISALQNRYPQKAPADRTIMIDLRYSPSVTEVMKQFIKAGGRAFNGSEMLFGQALYAFELFTGLSAPVEAMRQAYNKALEKGD
ncbi:MAG: shikimate dehydrogenase [Bacillota bacterium]|nr:shikimate dehydrogenase [Bacillota bacterium]